MLDVTFEEMGIPPGYGVRQLLFNPVANAVAVQLQSATPSWRPERLYFRQAKDHQYRPVGRPGDLISEECPFSHPTKPLLAYNCMRHSFSQSFSIEIEGEEIHSFDWDSLKIFDLRRDAEVDLVDRSSLQVPAGVKSARICEIVAFGESGLFVTVGLETGSSSIEYAVARLDLTSRRVDPLLKLPVAFL